MDKDYPLLGFSGICFHEHQNLFFHDNSFSQALSKSVFRENLFTQMTKLNQFLFHKNYNYIAFINFQTCTISNIHKSVHEYKHSISLKMLIKMCESKVISLKNFFHWAYLQWMPVIPGKTVCYNQMCAK